MTSDRWVISCELPADNEINILCYLVIILALALTISIAPLQSGYVLEKKSICGQWEKSNCESNRSDVYLTEVSLALPFCLAPWETLHTNQNPSQKYTILFFHKMIFLYLSFIVNKRRDIRLKTNTDWSNSNNQSFLNYGQGWLGHTMSESAELIISLNVLMFEYCFPFESDWSSCLKMLPLCLLDNQLNKYHFCNAFAPLPPFFNHSQGKIGEMPAHKKQISHRSWISWNDSLTPCECRFLMINELVFIF